MRTKKRQLVETLLAYAKRYEDDPEVGHAKADLALLAYIDDDEIAHAFDQVEKWYA